MMDVSAPLKKWVGAWVWFVSAFNKSKPFVLLGCAPARDCLNSSRLRPKRKSRASPLDQSSKK